MIIFEVNVKMIEYLVPLFFVGYLRGVESAIPNYIHICKRSDPNVTDCIKESVRHLLPKLKVGIPEIGAPPIEPFHLNNVSIFSKEDYAGFAASLHNIETTGASEFQITKLKLNIPQLVFRIFLKFPLLKIKANYDITGKILFLNLNGKGIFHGNVTNVDGKIITKAKIVDGHMKFVESDAKFIVGDYHVYLDNLFNGEPTLGQAANEVINDAKEDFLEIVLPLIEKEVARLVIEFGNKITDNFLFDEVFPK